MTRERRAGVWAVAIVAGGVVAFRLGFAPFEERAGWLAALTMWIAGGSGLVAWLRLPASRIGPLLVGASFAWGAAALLLGGLRGGDIVGRSVGLVYASVLGHAVASFPDGRLSRSTAVLVVAGYLACLLPAPNAETLVTLSTAAAVATRVLGRRSSSLPVLIAAAVAIGLGVGLGPHWRVLAPTVVPDPRVPAEAAIIVVTMLLSQALVHDVARRRELEDLLFGLGADGGDVLTRRLAKIAGDPALQIAYSLPGSAIWVDPAGRTIDPPFQPGLTTTPIKVNGTQVGVFVHEQSRLADSAVIQAISRTAALASTNARLQAEVLVQLGDVEASRVRLAQAADDERRSLRRRLEDGLGPVLADLEVAVVHATSDRSRDDDGDRAHGDATDHSIAYVREARREIAALADGLPPRALDRGLTRALAALVARFPLAVTFDPPADGPIDATAQAALYFACSEALTNAAKHANARTAAVRLCSVDGWATIEISDDGVGGADVEAGTGLRGLRDRLESLGGSLSIESASGHGTRILASVPTSTIRPAPA